MPEKECWTKHGRKKIYLVDGDNNIIKEIDDLGPLSEMEMKWVKSGCGVPFKEWLESQEAEDGEEEGEKGTENAENESQE